MADEDARPSAGNQDAAASSGPSADVAVATTSILAPVTRSLDPRAQWVGALLGSEHSAPKEKRACKHIGHGHVPATEGALTPPPP